MSDPKKVVPASQGSAVALDMDDARKERFKRVSEMIIDICQNELPNPIEAYAILNLCMESLSATYGIRDSFLLKPGSEKIQ